MLLSMGHGFTQVSADSLGVFEYKDTNFRKYFYRYLLGHRSSQIFTDLNYFLNLNYLSVFTCVYPCPINFFSFPALLPPNPQALDHDLSAMSYQLYLFNRYDDRVYRVLA